MKTQSGVDKVIAHLILKLKIRQKKIAYNTKHLTITGSTRSPGTVIYSLS